MWLIQAGAVHVKDQPAINVKQAHCLLHVAAWIQKHKTAEWLLTKDRMLLATSKSREQWHLERGRDPFMQVLSGTAGTGKQQWCC